MAADLAAASATGDGTDSLAGFEDLTGSANADQLRGDGVANRIDGGGGDDGLTGGGGDDVLEGGTGADTADYGGSPAPIDADLRAHSADGQGHDALGSVENVGGSPQADTLAGDDGANRLDGAGGDDTVSFAGSPAGIDTSLASGVTTGDGADVLAAVENVVGSSHDDTLVGDGAANEISGGAGADTLSSAGGNDRLVGADGADSLFGEDDDDEMSGGAGNDHLDGGTGVNVCDGGAGSNTYAGNCDDGAPVLTSLAIDPDSVDTSGSDQTVDFTLGVTDDASGVQAGSSSVTVHAPGGAPTFSDQIEPRHRDAPEWHLHGLDHAAALLGPGSMDRRRPPRRPAGQRGNPDQCAARRRRARARLPADRRRRHRRPGPHLVRDLARLDQHERRPGHGRLRPQRHRRSRRHRPGELAA